MQDGVLALYQASFQLLLAAYSTKLLDGTPASLRTTIRVAEAACTSCGKRQKLYPHALVSLTERKERHGERAILACPLGHIFYAGTDRSSACPVCDYPTDPLASYTPSRIVTCPSCAHRESLSLRAAKGDWKWQVVVVERVAKKKT